MHVFCRDPRPPSLHPFLPAPLLTHSPKFKDSLSFQILVYSLPSKDVSEDVSKSQIHNNPTYLGCSRHKIISALQWIDLSFIRLRPPKSSRHQLPSFINNKFQSSFPLSNEKNAQIFERKCNMLLNSHQSQVWISCRVPGS